MSETAKATPFGWRRVRLGDLLVSLRNGTTQTQTKEESSHPVTRIETIADGAINWKKTGYLEKPDENYRLEAGDILYSHINSVPHMGKVALYEGGNPLYHGMNLMLLRPKSSDVIPKFLFLVLASEVGRSYARRECKSAISQASLSQGQISQLELNIPEELDEQQQIIEVLSTLDTAIRETEALIDKLKAVKQGLLHDLLTRGIDVNGQLRRPESEAPQLYKESPLGWIPREWEIRQVQELGEAITGSTPPSVDPLAWGQGIPFITPGDIEDDRPISFVERQVSPRGQKYVRLLPAGSSLVVCIGSTIGKVGMTSAVACTNQQVNAVVPGNGTDSVFLFHALQMYAGQLRALAGLQAVPIVNKSSFESIMLPSPFYEEQVGISARVSAISNRLNSEAEQLEKLRQQKIGLMDDLLTGRVRVTPLLESV